MNKKSLIEYIDNWKLSYIRSAVPGVMLHSFPEISR